MKIISLTSNINSFRTVHFSETFNVIVGDPMKKDDNRSHNLGKTTIIKLLKFVLFNGSPKPFEKIKQKYPDATFTVKYNDKNTDYDFSRSFARRKKDEQKEIETFVDYEYFIRLQDEFDIPNPFKKPSYQGKDLYWKPRILGLLGFDNTLLENKLKLADEYNNIKKAIDAVQKINQSQIDKETEIQELEQRKTTIQQDIDQIKVFDSDNNDINLLVNSIDTKLAMIKPQIYELKTQIRKMNQSKTKLKQLSFDSSKIEQVFSEVNLYFSDSVKHDISELNKFYENLYNSRQEILNEQLVSDQDKLNIMETEAEELDVQRSSLLKQISNESSIQAYKTMHEKLVDIEKKLALLKQSSVEQNIKSLEDDLAKIQTQHMEAAAALARNIDESREKFEKINSIYKEIMHRVLKIDSEIKLEKNKTGNISIDVKSYKNGIETDELKGDTAKKLSAAAVDLSIRCIRNEDEGFIAQDSVIDNIDKNGAREFVAVVKELSEKYNFQYIMTALKDNLPDNIMKDDIAIELNDNSEKGLLLGFKY